MMFVDLKPITEVNSVALVTCRALEQTQIPALRLQEKKQSRCSVEKL